MSQLIGRDIGRYHIVEQLGEGGMAQVYKAYDHRLERVVAIKVILPSAQQDEMFLKRFEREAKALAAFSHANIVHVHDYGEQDGMSYLVMEYVPGGTLKQRLGKVMPYAEAARLLLPVAQALHAAHEKGILHRDVKPANILINASGQPMLSDFGIAKMLNPGQEGGATLTGAGVGIGTPEYMSPEQCLGWSVDARTDVYSLGVVFYELVTGRRPFQADTPMAVALKQINEPLPRPHDAVPDLPEATEQVIFKAMAKNPADRYAGMAAFAAALEKLAYGPVAAAPEATIVSSPAAASTIAAPEPATVKPAPGEAARDVAGSPPVVSGPVVATLPPAPVSKGRPAWVWAVLGLVAVALVGGGVWAILNGLKGGGQVPPLAMTNPTPKLPETPTVQPTIIQPSRGVVQSTATQVVFSGEIKVAILAPLTGSVPAYGTSTRNGALLAINQWNARGGVLGKRVVPVVEDSQCVAEPAVNAANKVINQDKIHYIIGEVCSNASIPVAKIANAAQVIQISPISTNPSLTVDPSGKVRDYVFRASFSDPDQGKAGAKFARETMQANTAFVLVNSSDEYTRGLAEAFSASFKDLGGKVSGIQNYSRGDSDFSSILANIANAKPDLVYLPDYYPTVNLITEQARARGIGIPFMGGDGWDSSELSLSATAGGYFTTHYSPEDPRIAVQNFLKDYKGEFGTDQNPDAMAALAYDATNLLLQAIGNASADDTARVRTALENISFDGVSGRITFDKNHNPLKDITVLAVRPDGIHFEAVVHPQPIGVAPSFSPADCGKPGVFCVGLVTEVGKIDDQGYNQSAWEAVQQAARDLGAVALYAETSSPNDYAANIARFADAHYNVVVTVGFAMNDATLAAARQYPNVKFIGVDQVQAEALPNLAGLIFPEDQGGYLVGVLAGSMTQTKKVGGVFGHDAVPAVWRFGEGFKAGVKSVDPSIAVDSIYNNNVGIDQSFANPEWGKTSAQLEIAKGDDVIFAAAGQTGIGALQAAAEKNVYAIGVDTDQWYTVPEAQKVLLSSAMKLITPGVFSLIKKATDGAFTGGNVTGEIGYAPFHDLESKVPAAVKARLEEVARGLADGTIQTGVPASKP